jgi:hypothetical protein
MTIGNKICNTCTRLKLCEGEEKMKRLTAIKKPLTPTHWG